MPRNKKVYKKVYVVEYLENLTLEQKKEVFDNLEEAMLFVKLNNKFIQECRSVYECEVEIRDGIEYFVVINKIIFNKWKKG